MLRSCSRADPEGHGQLPEGDQEGAEDVHPRERAGQAVGAILLIPRHPLPADPHAEAARKICPKYTPR